MAVLPLLLCGPVLRRVDATSLSVWVALSESRMVRLDIWSDVMNVGTGPEIAAPPRQPMATASLSTRRIGDHLHVALVTIRFNAAAGGGFLLPGALYSYNVTFSGGPQTADLRSLGLLQDRTISNGVKDGDAPASPEALGYENGLLPAFATAPVKIDDLHIVHCSCSKLHGGGESLLPQIDDLIKDVRNSPLKRPHQLFMTGDQIYADDVAAALLAALIPLGKMLLGSGTERLPVPQGAASTQLDATAENFPVGRRQTLVDNVARLTSDDAACHLLSFGEFAAMYVLNWSPAAWPVAWDDALTFAKAYGVQAGAMPDTWTSSSISPIDMHLTPLFAQFASGDQSSLAKATREGLKKAIDSFSDDQKAVKDSRDSIWKVRRALASIPTYCVDDDHEVTDDVWLTQGWRSQVLSNALGQAIIRNAYAAYVLFQGWGNDPAAFEPINNPPGAQMLTAVSSLFPIGGAWPDAASMKAIDPLLGFGVLEPQLRLDYVVDGPAHRAIVMDSRTRRAYTSTDSPPALLSDQAIQDQIVRGPFPQPLPAGLELLVVISPAPMLGPPLFEETLMPLAIRGFDAVWLALRSRRARSVAEQLTGIDRSKPTGSQFFDAEGWSANPVALEKMLAALAGYNCPVVVLAGDVHYASSHVLDYQTAGKPPVRLVHLTSSAAQNAWPAAVCSFLSSVAWARALLGAKAPVRRYGWKDSTPSLLDSIAGEPPPLVGKVKRHPVLLPEGGWRNHHTFQRPPDWVWSLDQLHDLRADSERPANAQPPPLTGNDLTPADAPTVTDLLHPAAGQLGYSALVGAHAKSMDRMFLARGVLFANNFGHVWFDRDARGVLNVTHELHSKRPHPDPNEDDEPYTVHHCSLTASPVGVPAGVGPL